MDITSYLIVNKDMAKTYPNKIRAIISNLERWSMLKIITCNKSIMKRNFIPINNMSINNKKKEIVSNIKKNKENKNKAYLIIE